MSLDWIRKTLQWFISLNGDNKLVIILLLLLTLNINVINMNKIEGLFQSERLEKYESERYTEKMTPIINTQLQYILMSMPNATNVILLNYHNNSHSSQGFSYRYITYLAEKFRDDEDMYGEEFKELSYVNYGEEFSKIHNLKKLEIKNLDDMQRTFPKLYRKLKTCNTTSIVFYPIEGVNEPVGMIIILSKSPLNTEIDYVKVIAPRIQRLAVILDYDHFKKQLND